MALTDFRSWNRFSIQVNHKPSLKYVYLVKSNSDINLYKLHLTSKPQIKLKNILMLLLLTRACKFKYYAF